MQQLSPDTTIHRLIPILTDADREGMLSYCDVYEKYELEFLRELGGTLTTRPLVSAVWGSVQEAEKNNLGMARRLRRAAIQENDWEPYLRYRYDQGTSYAKSGLDFKPWFDLMAILKDYFTECIRKEFATSPKLFPALKGMNRLVDIALCTIGEAYIQEKNRSVQQVSENLTSIFETTADCLFVLDVEPDNRYRFSSVNTSFQNVTGIPSEAIVGRYVHEVIPPDSLHLVLSKYEQAILEKKIVHWEETSTYPTGVLTGEVSIAPLFDDAGICHRLIGSVHDVTLRKQAEIEIKKLNDHLEQKVIERTAQYEAINHELEAFSYSVSHDLRAPLRAVQGYSTMLAELLEGELKGEAGRILSNIQYYSGRMEQLIEDLLAFSHIGRKQLVVSQVNMNSVVQKVIQEIEKSAPHRAEIQVGQLHQAVGDHSLLSQVFMNLIANAIKYSSKKEKPIVKIQSQQLGNEIIYSIRDNGAGFDMNYADKLFGVFQRLHADEEFEGTGVGLAIVKRVISKHGGRVWAEGQVNKGAVFYVSLTKQ